MAARNAWLWEIHGCIYASVKPVVMLADAITQRIGMRIGIFIKQTTQSLNPLSRARSGAGVILTVFFSSVYRGGIYDY